MALGIPLFLLWRVLGDTTKRKGTSLLIYNEKNLAEEVFIMQYAGLLAPIAFVFALAALSQIGALRKELAGVKDELATLKDKVEK